MNWDCSNYEAVATTLRDTSIYVKANKFHMSKIVVMGDNVHSEKTSRITTHACMLACTKRTSPY